MSTRKFILKGLNSVLMMTVVLTSSLAWATEELVIYSGRKDKFVEPVVEKFTEQTGIKVILHSGESTALLNKMKIEGARTQADLFISNDAGNLQKGSEMGLFSAMPGNLINEVPENLRSSSNEWIGLSARARVLVVNTKVKDLDWLTSVFDLADPRLKGRLGLTHSANESYIAGVTVYMEAIGKKKMAVWLEGMKANVDGEVFSKHSKIVKAVASGRRDVGLVNHYYIYRHLAKHADAPIKIVLPDQGKGGIGVAWNVAGIAISKYSGNQVAAQRFVKFLVSESGQKIFAEMNSEYPVRPGIAAAKAVPAAGSYKVANVPMSELGRKRDATIDLIESIGMP
jgi:iron(III) transport system substrate-binding protein